MGGAGLREWTGEKAASNHAAAFSSTRMYISFQVDIYMYAHVYIYLYAWVCVHADRLEVYS